MKSRTTYGGEDEDDDHLPPARFNPEFRTWHSARRVHGDVDDDDFDDDGDDDDGGDVGDDDDVVDDVMMISEHCFQSNCILCFCAWHFQNVHVCQGCDSDCRVLMMMLVVLMIIRRVKRTLLLGMYYCGSCNYDSANSRCLDHRDRAKPPNCSSKLPRQRRSATIKSEGPRQLEVGRAYADVPQDVQGPSKL